MFYQQISHIGEEQKRSKNLRVYNTRYQSEYNIRYLSLVKGLYYYNHRTKEYKHQDYWKKKIGF